MSNFRQSLNNLGFLRLAVVTPDMRVADVDYNTGVIISTIDLLAKENVQTVVFPELCLTGYSCEDLFHQNLLLEKAKLALNAISEAVNKHNIVTIVGLPLQIKNNLFNACAIIDNKCVVGFVLKAYHYHESDARWFSSAQACQEEVIKLHGKSVSVGLNLIFQAENQPECAFGILMTNNLTLSHSSFSALSSAGANLVINPSAIPEELGMGLARQKFVQHLSSSCTSIYALSVSGPNESSTDFVYSGHSMIVENGVVLAETERFNFATQIAKADVDLQAIVQARLKHKTGLVPTEKSNFRTIPFSLPVNSLNPRKHPFLRPIPIMPFISPSLSLSEAIFQEAFDIQSAGLAKRLKHTGLKTVTIGISGGLDSTLALLVCVNVFKILNLDRQGIYAITMPGPGTNEGTRRNARKLAESLGVNFMEIPIDKALAEHLAAIGHPEAVHDVTYENAQARERTQILMDMANQVNGLTVGTGDLSELALGWCTYNGDHMSMYNVNTGLPKTMIREMVKWFSENETNSSTATALKEVYEIPISPELLPPTGAGVPQNTEDIIGPYILNDFFLFYTLMSGFSPRKIFLMARQAFLSDYRATEILGWMKQFYKRFFLQQFKRSALPDGPKVLSVGLSPRGAWRMPSDVSPNLWMKAMAELEEEFGKVND